MSVRGREHTSESEGEGVHVSDRESEEKGGRCRVSEREVVYMLVTGRERPCQ